jgi:phosphate transport system ATP-binding protein
MTPDPTETEPEMKPADRHTLAAVAATSTEREQPRVTHAGRRVEVRDLCAYYGDHQVLRDVNLTVEPNTVMALIGPSGSGKSTVVRCVNRLHEELPGARSEGHVRLDDLDVYQPTVDVVAVRRSIGMDFQKPNPFPTMSIFDNVASGLRLTSRKVDRDRVESALQAAGLWDEVKNRLNQPGIGLSGGQQQRLCIARALAVEPEVLLMDEPASALDPVATLKIEELVDQLKARVTVIIVTHNMQQAARVADNTAFLLEGALVEVAPTEKIFTNPSDPRTEEYVTGKFG